MQIQGLASAQSAVIALVTIPQSILGLAHAIGSATAVGGIESRKIALAELIAVEAVLAALSAYPRTDAEIVVGQTTLTDLRAEQVDSEMTMETVMTTLVSP